MTTFAEHQAAPNPSAEDEARTGLAVPSTWRGVYVAVLLVFAALVGLMTGFTRFYA